MEKTQYALLVKELGKLESLTDRLQQELDQSLAENKALEKQLLSSQDQCEQYKSQLLDLNISLKDAESKRETSEIGHRECLQVNLELQTEVRRLESLLQETRKSIEDSEKRNEAAEKSKIEWETRVENSNKSFQTYIAELEEQANRAISQADSYQQRVLEYEQLLEEAVRANKTLEDEHQHCLDELQQALEHETVLKQDLLELTREKSEAESQFSIFESRERDMQMQLTNTTEELLATRGQKRDVEEAGFQQEAELSQYIIRKRRFLSLREKTLSEFKNSLVRFDNFI